MLGDFKGSLCFCDWLNRTNFKQVQRRVTGYLNTTIDEATTPLLDHTLQQLNGYFAGDENILSLPIVMAGTDFQQKVWRALTHIKIGQTATYKDIALRIGQPSAVRAVANAVGANAVSLFIPCHRIIGSDGSLTGYAGGKQAKYSLLQIEEEILKNRVIQNKNLK